MNPLDKLAELFGKFPGIGPRQARRFVYYLLYRNDDFSRELIRAIEETRRSVARCGRCFRYFPGPTNASLCPLCADAGRDDALLMLVPRDVDLEAVEKSRSFQGRYFVLGGVIPILDKEPEKHVRLHELESRLKSDTGIKEVILAMNANQDGEHTAEFIKEHFAREGLTFSTLGRGLSTGAELEYADPDTLRHALLHRTQ